MAKILGNFEGTLNLRDKFLELRTIIRDEIALVEAQYYRHVTWY